MKRTIAMTLMLVTLIACSVTPLANTKIDYAGFGQSAVFYVKTKDNGSTVNKVKATFSKGTMKVNGCSCHSGKNQYGSYEAIVYFKNSKGNWQ